MREKSWSLVLCLGAALWAAAPPVPAAENQPSRPLNVLVLLGEWFGDVYFPLKEEIEARGWTMKRVGLDGEYRGCYNKARDVVLRSDVVIQDKMDLSGFDALIIPSGPQWRKFNEDWTVLKFVQDAHAAGLVVASFCVGNTTVKAAGLVDLPSGPELFPEKMTRVGERVLIGPRGGGPPPGDGFESAPVKEICDAVAREIAGETVLQAEKSGGAPGALSLTYVANMGVLVGSEGTKVLVDALFDRPNPEYRAPGPGVLDQVIEGEAPFDGVNLALVTHNHPDHFSAAVAVRFLESRTQAILAAPEDAVAAMRAAASDWAKIESRVISLEVEVGDFRRLKAAGIPVTAVRTPHSGGGESPMNLMYLFEIDGRRVFHEGDSTGKPEVFQGFGLESAPVDLAVVHFWFPLDPDMSKHLQEVFRPEHIALGHLPTRLESDAPGKIDMVREHYKDLFLLLPGMPAKTFSPAGAIDFPSEPLISVWEHDDKVDIAPAVKEVGFNTVWTHDKPYDGAMKMEDTLMSRHLQTPGVKYVIAKIERGIWGWSFDEAMRHAAWIAELSLTRKEIIGLYLNDFYGETEETDKGGHSAEEFRRIIAKAKAINPRLAIWAPCYPPEDLEKPYDFDIDAIIFSFYDVTQLPKYEQLLDSVLKKFPGKPILGSLYLESDEGRWLTEQEFKGIIDYFVAKINEGRLAGLRVFRVQSLIERPDYVKWLRESLAKLKKR